jgi:hypothetical protein
MNRFMPSGAHWTSRWSLSGQVTASFIMPVIANPDGQLPQVRKNV